ncbi:MAG: hypothetical protein ABI210_04630, partial [Abditibacteriaceae bacterium]
GCGSGWGVAQLGLIAGGKTVALGFAAGYLAAAGGTAAIGAIGVSGTAIIATASPEITEDGSASLGAVTSQVTRALTEEDLGVTGLKTLKGSFTVEGKLATVRIDMIEGTIKNPFLVIQNLMATAKANGAEALQIEGTLANERLYEILQQRYGMETIPGGEVLRLPLK